MLIQQAFAGGAGLQFYLAVVITCVISIVLHELAHGWAAISRGDRTPIELGHMTGNPLVHMGATSLICLALFGLAWGQMPVNPSRMKGKYAGAFVSFAGPLMNIALALIAIFLLVAWIKISPDTYNSDHHVSENLFLLLRVFALLNLVLAMLNLIPIPPLDGSRILADFVPAYRNFLDTPQAAGIAMAGLFFIFFVAGRFLFPLASEIIARIMSIFL